MEEIKYEYKERGIGHADEGESVLRDLPGEYVTVVSDPPTETNSLSLQGHSSVFVPKGGHSLQARFEMVDARPSMPDTFDGCRFLAQTKMRGVRS